MAFAEYNVMHTVRCFTFHWANVQQTSGFRKSLAVNRTVATGGSFSLLVEFLKASAPNKGEESSKNPWTVPLQVMFVPLSHEWNQDAGLSLEKS